MSTTPSLSSKIRAALDGGAVLDGPALADAMGAAEPKERRRIINTAWAIANNGGGIEHTSEGFRLVAGWVPKRAANGTRKNCDRAAIRLLVAAGFVTEEKANEALNIAHGFDKGPLTASPQVDEGRELARIGELIRTQDNRITDSPIFIVQQKRWIAGTDPDYGGERVWVNHAVTGDEVTDEAEIARLDAEYAEDYTEPAGYTLTGKMYVWEFVTACFTEQGCKDYLARDGHNLCEPRIYAAGSYRNNEWRTVRSHLLALTPQPQGDASGQVSGGGDEVRTALQAAVEWAMPMEEAPKSSRPEWFDQARRALAPTQARPDDGEVVEKPCKECGAPVHVWANEANPICFGCYADLPAPTADGGAVAWFCECGDPQVTLDHGIAQEYARHVRVRPLIFGDHPAPKAEVARLVEAAKPTGTVADIPDDQLLARVMRHLAKRSRKKPAWGRISDAFALGSTYSAQLCVRFGIDPDTGKPFTAAQKEAADA